MHVTVYGPFFMETTITGIVHLDMLQKYLIPQLEKVGQEERIHFRRDGAPPHYLEEVGEYLNIRFPGRWIGRAAPIAWPPRSPDLTPLPFFLWGFVHFFMLYYLVYETKFGRNLVGRTDV
jgi:hypothetical protein